MIFAGKNYEQQQQQRVPADSKRPDDSSMLINEKCCISVNLTYSRLQINHQDSSALFDALLLGYVPLAEVAAELLFQVVAERAEKASVIVTTNLPFSEWPQVFTNARLCKAMLDRLTDQAHIIETGSESYRFRRTLRKKTKD